MKKTPWFDRKFPAIEDNDLFPTILERLDGTSARLTDKMTRLNLDLSHSKKGKWSIKKEIGHLIDLEPLWHERAQQILRGESQMLIADLTNQKTHQANHDDFSVSDLIKSFKKERHKLMKILQNINDDDLEKEAIHPRLGTPMRIIDLAFFVAEHDDHHLAQITFLMENDLNPL
jgi:uncharacterized damage-inducible protein DinB